LQGLAAPPGHAAHAWPSPVHPASQVHEYDPGVFSHVAFASQGADAAHSSTSAHWLPEHWYPAAHVPHDPRHPSSPHAFPAHDPVHALVAQAVHAALHVVASVAVTHAIVTPVPHAAVPHARKAFARSWAVIVPAARHSAWHDAAWPPCAQAATHSQTWPQRPVPWGVQAT
jgi:hypothetical protein